MTLLQKLRALAATEAKATPGPWEADAKYGAIKSAVGTVAMVDNHYKPVPERGFPESSEERASNAALIADARNLLKAALALVEAQHEALESAATRFESYVKLHATKGTPEGDQKAGENGIAAKRCRAALQLANQEQP